VKENNRNVGGAAGVKEIGAFERAHERRIAANRSGESCRGAGGEEETVHSMAEEHQHQEATPHQTDPAHFVIKGSTERRT